uniref:Armadillo repeat-containing protein 8 n=1 Tax=Hanusia phi TaxID=3032 RepID=A0A7S0EG47_9CRYP
MLSDPVVSEIVLAEDSISSMTGAFLQLLLVDDIRIQSIAARVLWTLAEIPERRQKLIQQDALEYIVRMIGARHDELQSAAMQVLSKFLCHEPKLLEVVLNHPVLPITLVDLASFAQREDVVGRALSCIFYMCVRDEHAVKVCELGLLDALLVLVRRQEAVVITNSMMIIAALSHLADQMKYLVKEHIARDLIKIRESDVGRTVENLACAAIGMFIKNFEGRELVEVRTRLTQDNVLDYLLETLVEGYTQDHTIVYEGCKSLMYFAADDHLSSEYCARKALKDLLRISKGEREISRLSLRSYILRALPEETLSPEQRDERRSERPRHLEWQAMRTIAALIYGGEPETVRYVLERGGLSAVIGLCLTGPYKLRQEGARAVSTVCLHCSSPEFCYEDYTVNAFREIANSQVIDVYIQVSLDPSSPADASAAAYDVLSYLHNFVDNETFIENSDPRIRSSPREEMAKSCALTSEDPVGRPAEAAEETSEESLSETSVTSITLSDTSVSELDDEG